MRAKNLLLIGGMAVVLVTGCWGRNVPGGGEETVRPGGDAVEVASRAIDVAEQIGGPAGFGGHMMDGYADHHMGMMDYWQDDDLADPEATVTVVIANQSSEEAVFHLSYFASYLSPDDQLADVVIEAGAEQSIEVPCAEMVGMGGFMPGAAGCHLLSGLEVGNTWAVPMFLGLDFACGDTLNFVLGADAEDLDEDGDADELVLVSDGLLIPLVDGGEYPDGWMGGPMPCCGGMMGPGMMYGGGMMRGGSWMMGYR